MLLPQALALALLTPAPLQGPARDLTRLFPVYRASAAEIPAKGEQMRLGSFMPSANEIPRLSSIGVNLFMSETDKLTAPSEGDGVYSIANLSAQHAAALAAGAIWAIGIYTTFPTPDKALAVGEGTVDALSGARVAAWSPWNPERIRWSANRLGEINRKFPNTGVVDLGVFGEYGDASFFTGLGAISPAYAKRWQELMKTDLPTLGFWSGDEFAKQSWQKFVLTKHGSIASALTDWGMSGDLSKLPMPIGPAFPGRARAEYQDWYRAAIPSLVHSLGDIGKNIFKESSIMIPIGPASDSPELGLDIFSTVQTVGEWADAINVTNIGYYDFAGNWAMSLARIRGAAFGVPIITEASTGRPNDFAEHLFESISLGARAHIGWPEAFESAERELSGISQDLVVSNPKVDVAVLHPTTSHLLQPTEPAPPLTYRGSVELRDYADFDELEESAVDAGALDRYRVAVVFEGSFWRAETLQAISDWVDRGGVLVAYDFGKMEDLTGNTGIYQRLFGFASGLKPATETTRWVGDLPGAYAIDIGNRYDGDYLLGGWGPVVDGCRAASSGASLRFPVAPAQDSLITIKFGKFPPEGKTLEIWSKDKMLASISADGGLQEFGFALRRDLFPSGIGRLEFRSSPGGFAPPVDSVEVATSGGEPVPLKGRFEAPVDIADVKSWAHKQGKGLVIFQPAKRDSWKQFLSVVRLAIYGLSQIDPGRADAPIFDDKKDAVYMTDLGDSIAIFNSGSADVQRTIFGKSISIPAGSLRFATAGDAPVTDVYQAEATPGLALPGVSAPEASPGKGATAVRVSPGQTLNIPITVAKPGRYKLFARTLRNGALSEVGFKVGDVEASPTVTSSAHATYFVGEFDLPAGKTTVSLGSNEPFLADLIVISNSPRIAGFQFPVLAAPNG